MKQESEQLNLFDYVAEQEGPFVFGGCEKCVCENCLYWWSQRCPHGKCWDDYRAKTDPYDKAHPDKPPRTQWTNWRTDQAYWCRGGTFYPIHYCEHFVKYKGQKVKWCLDCNVSVFQDGYILCSQVETMGCEACYKKFLEGLEREDADV